MDNSIKEKVIQMLMTLPVCKVSSNKKNWTVRCPYCGDSKTANHGHFSILIDLNSNTPMLYRCFRCNESGIFTDKTLEDLNLYLSASDRNQLNYYNRLSGGNSNITSEPKRYKVPEYTDTTLNRLKLQYLNDRIGGSLSFSDTTQYKIIISLKEFLRYNHLNANTMQDTMLRDTIINELESRYIGFLSSNNNKITFRNIDGNGYFGRYYKLTIDLLNTSENTFYSLASSYDLLYTSDIHIHITEGTFDILGVYLNTDQTAYSNSIYIASCGFGFGRIIQYLIYKGVTTDIILHVYSDSDKTDDDIRRILNRNFYKMWIKEIFIHRNIYPGEKDYGVPKNRINDYKYLINLK